MAGPLSSEEIEDVVSSVRRLVSNELSPRRASRDLGADRLLLTPSLRVVSELSPLAPQVPEEDTRPVVEPAPTVPEAVEPAADDAVELIEAEWEDEIWVEADQSPLGEVALGAEEAEVLVTDDAGDDALAAATDDLSEAWVEDEALVVGPPTVDAPAEDSVAEFDGGRPDELALNELAPAASDPAETPETPEAVMESAAVGAAAQDGPAPRMSADIIDADGTPLAVLDEAALQEIVRQMIREELQGDLGERITRNVRKLVRAEINRALIARDLD